MIWYNILKQLREESGKSMSAVATSLDIPKGTYASYEYGKREPNITMIKKLADFYNVSTDYILGREQKDEPAPAPENDKPDRIKEHLKAINDILDEE